MNCPSCGTPNNDNWPINVNGVIMDGGCQDCWENKCGLEWAKMLNGIEIKGFKNESTKAELDIY